MVATLRRMFSCADISKPTPPAPRPDDGRKSKPLAVTGRLKTALDNMVWAGMQRDEAARAAGLTPHALYSALRKPHVKAEYLAQCEVLRTSGRARRIHRLEAMVEQDDNKAAVVNAALALDRDMGNSPTQSGTSAAMPGVTIHIHAAPAAGPQPANVRVIDANPLITHGSDILHENVVADE